MLWDIVYDFFVMYIFGGTSTNGVGYYSLMGVGFDNNTYGSFSLANIIGYKFRSLGGEDYYISLGSYFSLIATIISMVAIVLICCALIKKIYNMCAHIIG